MTTSQDLLSADHTSYARPTGRHTTHHGGGLPPQGRSLDRVEAVLRGLPSHGWTEGWTGRRDRALLVLSELVGMTFGQIAALTAGDVVIAGGAATIRMPGRKLVLRDNKDDLLCGPCALARWVHALDLTVVFPNSRVIASVIGRAVPLTPESPHLCQSNNAITEMTGRVALLPPIDRWDHSIRTVIPHETPARRQVSYDPSVVPVRRPGGRAAAIAPDTDQRADGLQTRVEQLLSWGP